MVSFNNYRYILAHVYAQAYTHVYIHNHTNVQKRVTCVHIYIYITKIKNLWLFISINSSDHTDRSQSVNQFQYLLFS